VRVWEVETGRELAALKGHRGWVITATFSPDGGRVVTAGQDGGRVWEVVTGREIAVLRGHSTWLQSASFSADGARIVTASGDNTARLWDARTGQEIAALRGHERIVRSAAFSQDASRVAVSDDGTVRVWDVSWATHLRGEALRHSVCAEKLIGAQDFTSRDVEDPVLEGLLGSNPCLRRGPLSLDYWTRRWWISGFS